MGARLGYGLPFGNASAGDGHEVKQLIVGQVPFWLDAGARINQRFFVGAYFHYGFGIESSTVSDLCKADKADAAAADVDVSCNVHETRLGAEFLYHILPMQDLDPWVGIGFGYEWLGLSETADSGEASATQTIGAHGFEFINLQLGLDFSVSENVGLGPFVAFSLAEYRKGTLSCSGDCSADSISGDIGGKALHEWLLFGARVTFQL
jgi:hypothetical protein